MDGPRARGRRSPRTSQAPGGGHGRVSLAAASTLDVPSALPMVNHGATGDAGYDVVDYTGTRRGNGNGTGDGGGGGGSDDPDPQDTSFVDGFTFGDDEAAADGGDAGGGGPAASGATGGAGKGKEGGEEEEEDEEEEDLYDEDGRIHVSEAIYDQYHANLRRIFAENAERASMYDVERGEGAAARVDFNGHLCTMEDDTAAARAKWTHKREVARLQRERLRLAKQRKKQQKKKAAAGGAGGPSSPRAAARPPHVVARILRYNPWLHELYYPHMFSTDAQRVLTPIEKVMVEIDGFAPSTLLGPLVETFKSHGAVQVGNEYYIHVRDLGRYLRGQGGAVSPEDLMHFVERYHTKHPLLSTGDFRSFVDDVIFAPEMRYLAVFACFLKLMAPKDAARRDLKMAGFRGNETTTAATVQELAAAGSPIAKRALAQSRPPHGLPYNADRHATLTLAAFVKMLHESDVQFSNFFGVMVDAAYDLQACFDIPAVEGESDGPPAPAGRLSRV